MPNATPPPAPDLARQKVIIRCVMILLVVMAVLVLTVVPRIPLPVRIAVAVTDVLGAIVLGVALRPKPSGK